MTGGLGVLGHPGVVFQPDAEGGKQVLDQGFDIGFGLRREVFGDVDLAHGFGHQAIDRGEHILLDLTLFQYAVERLLVAEEDIAHLLIEIWRGAHHHLQVQIVLDCLQIGFVQGGGQVFR